MLINEINDKGREHRCGNGGHRADIKFLPVRDVDYTQFNIGTHVKIRLIMKY